MSAVGIRAAARYGVALLGYFLVFGLVGGIIAEVGIELFLLDSPFLTAVGVVFVAIGVLIVYVGVLGVGYKVIADGVERGIRSAQLPGKEVERESAPGQRLVEAVVGDNDRDGRD